MQNNLYVWRCTESGVLNEPRDMIHRREGKVYCRGRKWPVETQRHKQISSMKSSNEYQEIRLVRKSRSLEGHSKTFGFHTEGISIFKDS